MRPGRNGGTLKTGNTVNVGRKPEKLLTVIHKALKIDADDPEALESSELMEILKSIIEKAKKGDVKAAELILNFTFGKPRQMIEVQTREFPSPPPLVFLEPDEKKIKTEPVHTDLF